jgi:hypothetical protein
MAKPRIFISSTYYDLKHIRKSIELFIDEVGYESVLFENGDIAFDPYKALDESCYTELNNCHIFVLIIGGRYGTASSDNKIQEKTEKEYSFFNSITKKEYDTARKNGIPIYIFIEKGVAAEYRTYKENKDNQSIKYAHVDSVNIFRLIDSIYSERRNNLVKEFENVSEITEWLKIQWAGLFTKYLAKSEDENSIQSLQSQLVDLNVVVTSLKEYSEKIIQNLDTDNAESIIKNIDEEAKNRMKENLFFNSPIIKGFFELPLVDENEEGDDYGHSLYEEFLKSEDMAEFAKKMRDIGLKRNKYQIIVDSTMITTLQNLKNHINNMLEDKERYRPSKDYSR